jgi:predicted permease
LTIQQAAAEFEILNNQMMPSNTAGEQSGHPGIFSLYGVVIGKYEAALWTLFVAIMLLLLIACANVSNLILARGVGREQELAIRASFGASRWSLFRLLLTENMLLSLASGALGVGCAYWGVLMLRALRLGDIPRFETAHLNFHVVIFALGVSVMSGILSGIIPAYRTSRANLLVSLQVGSTTTQPIRHRQLRDLIVSLETAVALILLVGAGLLINSFLRMARSDWGFRSSNVLMLDVKLPSYMIWNHRLPRETFVRLNSEAVQRQALFAESILARIRTLPGVDSAAAAQGVPIRWSSVKATTLGVEGRLVTGSIGTWVVGPDYFRTLGIPILRGREFNAQVADSAPRGVVISKALAERLWGLSESLGKQIDVLELKNDGFSYLPEIQDRLQRKDTTIYQDPSAWQRVGGIPYEVIGVAGDVRMFGLQMDPNPAVYVKGSVRC